MSEANPTGNREPLSLEIAGAPPAQLNYGQTERYGSPVLNLNQDALGETARRFLDLVGSGKVSLTRVSFIDYNVDPSIGHTTLVRGVVTHRVEDEPGEFDGWYIGLEASGEAAITLLSPEKVTRRDSRPSPRDAITLEFLRRVTDE